MGRTVFVDHNVGEKLLRRESSINCNFGLLLGQTYGSKDYIIDVCRTLPPLDNEGEVLIAKRVVDIRDSWVSTHAKQLLRMLPGGIDIIGVYAESSDATISVPKLKQIVLALENSLKKQQHNTVNRSPSYRLLLLINTTSKRFSLSCLDVKDVSQTVKPADWKTQSLHDRWIAIGGVLSLDIEASISSLDATNITEVFKKQLKGLEGSKIALNGQILNNDTQVNLSTTKRASKTEFPIDYIECCLLQQQKREETNQIIKNGHVVRLRGTCMLQATVFEEASASDVIGAILTDAVRTVEARLLLWKEEAEGGIISRLQDSVPRRVFASSADSALLISDYVFPDEDLAESLERLSDLSNVNCSVEELFGETCYVGAADAVVSPKNMQKSSKSLLPLSWLWALLTVLLSLLCYVLLAAME